MIKKFIAVALLGLVSFASFSTSAQAETVRRHRVIRHRAVHHRAVHHHHRGR